jgi:hypothetical protein
LRRDTVLGVPDRVDFYRVSLRCRAAPTLGCGSRAKPLLLELERNPAVAEAWLNRAGTLVAVVWKDVAARDPVLRSLLETSRRRVEKLHGKDRDKGLEDFLSGAGWHRGAEVDRLSEEEAEIIAARFVRRLRAKLTLSDDKADVLRSAFAEVCAHELLHHSAKSEKARRDRIAAGIVEAGLRHLEETEIVMLHQVVAAGHRPLRNEE